MHGLPRRVLLSEHLHRDLLEPLTAQTLIKLVEAHLRIKPKNLRKSNERLLIGLCLRTRVVGKCLESLGTLPLLGDARDQRPILASHRIVESSHIVAGLDHSTPILWRRPDGFLNSRRLTAKGGATGVP
jgi:hypothetical protein